MMKSYLKSNLVNKCAFFALVFYFFCINSYAALLDEEQVYTGEINDVGQWGLELHLNRTLKGITQPSYLGEKVNANATRLTPEISFGLSDTFEAGLYLPVVQGADGKTELAGHKWRLKWLPIQAKDNQGWFAGLNTEFSQLKYAYSDSSRAIELRTILGWQNEDWLLATNPVFDWAVSPGFSHHSPDFNLGLKAAKKWSASSSFGVEYYGGMGRLNDSLPGSLQDKKLYITWEHEGEPVDFHLALGRGLNSNSDAWTIKSIFGFAF